MRLWFASLLGATLLVGCGIPNAGVCSGQSPSNSPVEAVQGSYETVPPPDGSCASEATTKSLQTTTPVKVEFDNRTAVTLELFWVDFTGQRVAYAQIGPGQSYIQDTWFTHAWVVADPSGKCLTLFVANPYRSVVTVGDGALLVETPIAGTTVGQTQPATTPTPTAYAGGQATVPPPDGSCTREGQTKSLNDKTATQVEFDNRTGVTLQLLWLNFSGQRVFYAQIPGGHSYIQRTWFTHAWIVADLSGTCLTLFVANPYRSVVQIGDGPLVTGPPSTASASATPSPEPSPSASPSGSTAVASPSAAPSASAMECVNPPTSPISGAGNTVITVPYPYNMIDTLVTVKYSGSGSFAVQSLAADDTPEELLVSTTGAYSGVEAMDFDGSEPSAKLRITAAPGTWTVTFSDPATSPEFSTSTSGVGDAVLHYSGSTGIATITDTTQSSFNFRVIGWDALGLAGIYLVDAHGSYSGSIPFDVNRGYVAIKSDGHWTISVSAQ